MNRKLKTCEAEIKTYLECRGKLANFLKSENVRILCKKCNDSDGENGAVAFSTNSNPPEIVLCANRVRSSEFLPTINHEAIHIFDFLTNRYDFSSPYGLASSEVRAAREGECNRYFIFQFMRNYCIRRHAINSTRNIFPSEAENAVDRIFKQALDDDEPKE
jgi:hypothetical protein